MTEIANKVETAQGVVTKAKRETATITAFVPSKYGTKVEINDDEIIYIDDRIVVETGMEIKFSRHAAGETLKLMNGNDVTFKKDGIHDVMVLKSARRADMEFKEKARSLASIEADV